MKKIKLFIPALICAMELTACNNTPEAAVSAENAAPEAPTFQEVLVSRRSVRDYDSTKTISKEEVTTLLKAVQEAPSWANQQSTRYYVVMSPEQLKALKDIMPEGNRKSVQNAPVILVTTYVKNVSGFFQDKPLNEVGNGWGCYDNGVSNAFLILQAKAMGFDTLIMGQGDFDGVRELLGIPDTEAVTSTISLGYRASDPQRPERKALEEVVKFY